MQRVSSARRGQCFTEIRVESSSKLILMPELWFRCDDWIKKISWSWCHSVGMKWCYSQCLSDRIRPKRRGATETLISPFITIFPIWWYHDSKSRSKKEDNDRKTFLICGQMLRHTSASTPRSYSSLGTSWSSSNGSIWRKLCCTHPVGELGAAVVALW